LSVPTRDSHELINYTIELQYVSLLPLKSINSSAISQCKFRSVLSGFIRMQKVTGPGTQIVSNDEWYTSSSRKWVIGVIILTNKVMTVSNFNAFAMWPLLFHLSLVA
ncbi:hypothetical protein L9F63_013215, partial [Diploptera punctata]